MNTWSKLRHLFERDDGSLPDIFVEGLSPDEVVAAHEWLMSKCHPAEDDVVWSYEEQRDILLRDIPHPARAMYLGHLTLFRHLLVGLAMDGVELPLLSVFVCLDEFSFDYRMGPEWNEQRVLALFEVLRMLRTFAPKARISRADEGARLDERDPEFAEAFEAYVSARST